MTNLLPGHGDHSQSHSATDPDTVLEVLNGSSTPLLGSEAISAVLEKFLGKISWFLTYWRAKVHHVYSQRSADGLEGENHFENLKKQFEKSDKSNMFSRGRQLVKIRNCK